MATTKELKKGGNCQTPFLFFPINAALAVNTEKCLSDTKIAKLRPRRKKKQPKRAIDNRRKANQIKSNARGQLSHQLENFAIKRKEKVGKQLLSRSHFLSHALYLSLSLSLSLSLFVSLSLPPSLCL
jgi:hypothetical protein